MATPTTTQTRNTLVHDIDRLKRNAAQVAEDLKNHANAHVDETKKKVTGTIQSVRKNVVDQPLALLVIGFAAGLLLGWRLRR